MAAADDRDILPPVGKAGSRPAGRAAVAEASARLDAQREIGDPHRHPGAARRRRRHIRKYAEGQLGEDKSFYFRGPDNRLNLRAQNLNMFVQIAEGVDDATWLHHLRAGDYSRWLRDAIKDGEEGG